MDSGITTRESRLAWLRWGGSPIERVGAYQTLARQTAPTALAHLHTASASSPCVRSALADTPPARVSIGRGLPTPRRGHVLTVSTRPFPCLPRRSLPELASQEFPPMARCGRDWMVGEPVGVDVPHLSPRNARGRQVSDRLNATPGSPFFAAPLPLEDAGHWHGRDPVLRKGTQPRRSSFRFVSCQLRSLPRCQ